MKEGPDIIAPTAPTMLAALMSGKALTASALAAEAGVMQQTASAHLKKLEEADRLQHRKQGRYLYFTLVDEEVAQRLESIVDLAAKRGLLRTRTGPKDPELRKAIWR